MLSIIPAVDVDTQTTPQDLPLSARLLLAWNVARPSMLTALSGIDEFSHDSVSIIAQQFLISSFEVSSNCR